MHVQTSLSTFTLTMRKRGTRNIHNPIKTFIEEKGGRREKERCFRRKLDEGIMQSLSVTHSVSEWDNLFQYKLLEGQSKIESYTYIKCAWSSIEVVVRPKGYGSSTVWRRSACPLIETFERSLENLVVGEEEKKDRKGPKISTARNCADPSWENGIEKEMERKA